MRMRVRKEMRVRVRTKMRTRMRVGTRMRVRVQRRESVCEDDNESGVRGRRLETESEVKGES